MYAYVCDRFNYNSTVPLRLLNCNSFKDRRRWLDLYIAPLELY